MKNSIKFVLLLARDLPYFQPLFLYFFKRTGHFDDVPIFFEVEHSQREFEFDKL